MIVQTDVLLLALCAAAVVWDLRCGKIPNWLIVTGLAAGLCVQVWENRVLGIFWFLGGVGLPVLAGAAVYYFRMMGAGDLKLLAVAGGFFGPQGALQCTAVSVLAGGILAVFLVWKRRNLKQRLLYFAAYVRDMQTSNVWKPYLSPGDQGGGMHFSPAILIAVLLCRIG